MLEGSSVSSVDNDENNDKDNDDDNDDDNDEEAATHCQRTLFTNFFYVYLQ